MNQSILPSSTSKGNLRFREIIKSNPALLEEVADAKIFNEIAHQLYTLRREKGFTQKDLADKIKLKQSHISRWEKAGYQGYKIKVLSKLARTLGGSLEVNLRPRSHNYTVYCKYEEKDQTSYPNGIVHTRTESLVLPVTISAFGSK